MLTFLTKQETLSIITNNTSFYQTFTQSDLYARHVTSVNEYIAKLKEKKVSSSPTIYQQFVLQICAFFADIRLYMNENIHSLDGIASLPWKIGITNNDFYEGGMPHTIKSINSIVIIIPSKIIEEYSWNELIKTLIHEKVHVYQKMFPEKIDRYLKEKQYSPSEFKRDINTLYRANPDIDSTIYVHLPTNKIYDMKYSSSKPLKINDTAHYLPENEHPYEEMAIQVENI